MFVFVSYRSLVLTYDPAVRKVITVTRISTQDYLPQIQVITESIKTFRPYLRVFQFYPSKQLTKL
jgi:hypothetical protein